jgi:pyridoxamine 5'-phosphate oxidase
MIEFINLSRKKPYSIFKEKYDLALKNGQKNIEAMSISTYNTEKKEVDSRYVNLKFIDQENFIFFTNYNSPKSLAIKSHNQISALFFWQTINIQIRINAKIYRTTEEFNMNYFKQRSKEKNALAIRFFS